VGGKKRGEIFFGSKRGRPLAALGLTGEERKLFIRRREGRGFFRRDAEEGEEDLFSLKKKAKGRLGNVRKRGASGEKKV